MRLYRILDALTNKIEKMYPIGSVYISTMATNPAESLGFGTWQRIEGRFLVAAGQVGANDANSWGEIGATPLAFAARERGGYTDATLPEHNHEQDSHGHAIGPHSHSVPGHTHTIPAHNHAPGSGSKYITTNGTYAGEVVSSVGGSGYRLFKVQEAAAFYTPTVTAANTAGRETDANNAQTTDATVATCEGAVGFNKPAGVLPNNRNIPPFFGVYVWERTA